MIIGAGQPRCAGHCFSENLLVPSSNLQPMTPMKRFDKIEFVLTCAIRVSNFFGPAPFAGNSPQKCVKNHGGGAGKK
jgi:hypothetical protein